MSLFPRARPSPPPKRTRAPRLRTHQFHDSGQTTWNGEELCVEPCSQPKGHRVHDVQVDEQANVIDTRKLGESE